MLTKYRTSHFEGDCNSGKVLQNKHDLRRKPALMANIRVLKERWGARH